jgi:hypothetical protein
MIKTNSITYKIFLFERVKKKTRFLNTETYPLQVRLTLGTRTIYIKSHIFSLLQLNKYQQDIPACNPSIIMAKIIALEEELIQYLLHSTINNSSLDAIRQQYFFLSHDILHDLDERFKQFLVDFFYTENLPAYSLFIRNDGANHRSEFILHNLEHSLQPAVFEKLLAMAAEKAPPFIPLIRFYRAKLENTIPVLPVYRWKQEQLAAPFLSYTESFFPEYSGRYPVKYIQQLLEKIDPRG